MTENKSIKEEIEKEISDKAEIEITINSVGGQKILNNLKKGIVASINEICSQYKTATHPELIASVAKLKERYDIYTMLQGVKRAKKVAMKDLEELLKEEDTL